MAEFSIIDEHFSGVGQQHKETLLGVGDDAAVVSVPRGYELAISVDSMCEGTHFFANTAPKLLAHKLLAVNLSDMAAMGAQPKWATLAISLNAVNLNETNDTWLADFSTELDVLSKQFNVHLIGGDTTQTEGPLVLSLTILGLLPMGKRLTRQGAQAGDNVYCTGTLGDAALALAHLLGQESLSDDTLEKVLPALHQPKPQLEVGKAMLEHATSCLDISDGLIGDAEHIAKQSNVELQINLENVPLSQAYQDYLNDSQNSTKKYALHGGDDYELLFTALPEKAPYIEAMASQLDVAISHIGHVVDHVVSHTASSDAAAVTLFENGKKISIKDKSYQHFSA